MEVAGLLERSSLRSLGFSIGVATSVLPDLRQSGMNAWHSLHMRGMQLLVITVFSNTLRHAEDVTSGLVPSENQTCHEFLPASDIWQFETPHDRVADRDGGGMDFDQYFVVARRWFGDVYQLQHFRGPYWV